MDIEKGKIVDVLEDEELEREMNIVLEVHGPWRVLAFVVGYPVMKLRGRPRLCLKIVERLLSLLWWYVGELEHVKEELKGELDKDG